MAVISGRYGSVQRLLPVNIDDTGVVTWQTVDPIAMSGSFSDWNTNFAKPNLDNGGMATTNETTVSTVTSWSLENTVNPIPYIASNTRGYEGQLEGLHSATGQINGLGGCPPIAPGQRFKFLGFVGPSNGVLDSTAGHVYQIAAIANTITITLNYGMTQPITWQVSWQSDWQQDGDELLHNVYSLTEGDVQAITGFWDYTRPPCETLMPSRACNLEIGDRDASLGKICLVDANIQFNTEVATYANSCSAKAGGWQSGVVGKTSCQLSTNIQGDHYEIVNGTCIPGSNHKVRIYVSGRNNEDENSSCDDLAYWEFYKMMVGSYGGLNVDMNSNNPLQFSCQMNFNAFPDCDPGYIRYKGEGANAEEVYFVDLRPESEK